VVDGRDLAGLKLLDYRDHLGVVLQDNFLFDGTVAENIEFSRPGATRAQIEEVSRIAHCDEFIQGFPNGYDTVVGERGITLSGGQRQRTALARALAVDPRVLVLDDALSSVDTYTEEEILRGLRVVMASRTTFLVSHRVSTVKDADQILVLQGGRVVERGTHAQLLAQGGFYADLHRRQLLEEEVERTA
jgi:ABC-type multidrug transport system fused ATPase/permease subunit